MNHQFSEYDLLEANLKIATHELREAVERLRNVNRDQAILTRPLVWDAFRLAQELHRTYEDAWVSSLIQRPA